jgi:hypothetical protein
MAHPVPGRSHHDPYRVLGVDADASRQDILRAYRRAVHGVHPDAQPADPSAAARFQELTDAYDLLSDPARRAAYDRAHHLAADAGGPPSPPTYPGAIPRWPGSRHLLVPPPGQQVVGGPVHIEPPAAPASGQDQASPPAAKFEDPPVILGAWPGRRWSRSGPGVVQHLGAAELNGLHPHTLRLYEQEGLLSPARSPGGARRCSTDDIDRLHQIMALTSDGVNLAGVRRILQLQEQTRNLQAELEQLKAAARGIASGRAS